MSESKRNLSKARDAAQEEKTSLNASKTILQSTDSPKLRSEADIINEDIKRADNRINSIDRVIESIDYAVRRFQEVDEGCANRIKKINIKPKIDAGLLPIKGTFGVGLLGNIVPAGTKCMASM